MFNTIRVLGIIVLLGACTTSPFDADSIANEVKTTAPNSAPAAVCICHVECADTGMLFSAVSAQQPPAWVCARAMSRCANACDPSACFISDAECEPI